MKTVSKKQAISAKKISFSALFCALCCVGTIVIAIPLPNGYFNVGDVFVLLAGWCLGPVYGAISAALGSALADVISGWTLYAPATFVIKGVEALLAYFVCYFWKKCLKNDKLDIVARIISAVGGGLCMVLGYFFYESILYGFGGAAASLVGNFTQAACCVTCACILIAALYPVKGVKKLFPYLSISIH